MAATRTRRPRTVRPCAAAPLGCTCMSDTVEHNLQALDRIKARQAAAPRSRCTECGCEGNAAIIAALGRCFDCKRDADAAVYGFAPSARNR